jgi:hypothetical protein
VPAVEAEHEQQGETHLPDDHERRRDAEPPDARVAHRVRRRRSGRFAAFAVPQPQPRPPTRPAWRPRARRERRRARRLRQQAAPGSRRRRRGASARVPSANAVKTPITSTSASSNASWIAGPSAGKPLSRQQRRRGARSHRQRHPAIAVDGRSSLSSVLRTRGGPEAAPRVRRMSPLVTPPWSAGSGGRGGWTWWVSSPPPGRPPCPWPGRCCSPRRRHRPARRGPC